VARLASAVYAETRGESYLTCIVVRIDEERRSITSTTAGHPSALIAGLPLRRLTSGGPPAGLFPNAGYEQERHNSSRVIVSSSSPTESPNVFPQVSSLPLSASTVVCQRTTCALRS
jgi:hypothetical protein